MNIKHLYIIIPAAGSSQRMGQNLNKQAMLLLNKPVLIHTLEAFQSFACLYNQKNKNQSLKLHGIVVTTQSFISELKGLCNLHHLDWIESIIEGKDSRQNSVAQGVDYLKNLSRPPLEKEIVFIHDGARCLIDFQTLENCLFCGEKFKIAVASTWVKDTIKVLQPSKKPVNPATALGFTHQTLDRSHLVAVQTPQVFQYDCLVTVFSQAQKSNIQATDDVSLAEALGMEVALAKGSYQNLKITTPEDLDLAAFILQQRQNISKDTSFS